MKQPALVWVLSRSGPELRIWVEVILGEVIQGSTVHEWAARQGDRQVSEGHSSGRLGCSPARYPLRDHVEHSSE